MYERISFESFISGYPLNKKKKSLNVFDPLLIHRQHICYSPGYPTFSNLYILLNHKKKNSQYSICVKISNDVIAFLRSI